MKNIGRIFAALIAVAFIGALAADGAPSPETPIALYIYPAGQFFTPTGIPELEGLYCLAGLDTQGNPVIHCAPSPFLT